MIRVYADVVADLFHYGHAEFFRRAREFGDVLVVGVHSDEEVARYKRLPFLTMEERIGVVQACRYVDEVLPNAPIAVTREWIERHDLDLVVHGDDFDEEMASMYSVASELGILRLVPYTPGISTSEIAARIRARRDDA